MDLVEYQNHFARPNQRFPASPPNASEGLGDKGQGWQARPLCDDDIARIFSRGAEMCTARQDPSPGLGYLSQAGK